MPIVCGVKFRGVGKVYYFAPGEVQDVQVNDHVIVETARGQEMGQVILPPHEVEESEIVGQLKPILRRATPADLLEAQRYQRQEPEALALCKEQVAKSGLPMKVVSAEYNYDGSRLTFCFSSEQRVDFRDLVRDLARIFKTRIELRQIGVRDEARIYGGLGKCGRMLCCCTWLTDFHPVSIRMAKQQDLPLSPMEISGSCGRLLCCLEYENDYYKEVKGKFPKVGKPLETPLGPGKVIHVSVLRETVHVLLEDGSTLELTADQLNGTSPIEVAGTQRKLNGAQARTLDALVGPAPVAAEEDATEEAFAGAANGEQATAPETATPRKRRSKRRQTKGQAKAPAAEAPAADRRNDQQSTAQGEQRPAGQRSPRKRRPRRPGSAEQAPQHAKPAAAEATSGAAEGHTDKRRARRRRGGKAARRNAAAHGPSEAEGGS